MLKIERNIVLLALVIALAVKIWPGYKSSGTAIRNVEKASYYNRAAFIVASTKRIAVDLRAGRNREYVQKTEKRYFDNHLIAETKRREAAHNADVVARRLGKTTLGWYATLDNRTTAECRAANGKNFSIAMMPVIGYPGAVHIHCRCKAGPPHRGAKLLESTTRPEDRR